MGKGRPAMPIGTYGKIHISHDGPSKYRARARFRDPDGVTRPVVKYGQSKRDATDNLKAALTIRQRDAIASTVGAQSTVSALADTWFAQGSWASNTEDTYRFVIKNQVKPELGAVRLSELRPALVARALSRIRDGVGPGAAKTTKTVLAGMFDYAVAQDAMQANPARIKVSISRATRKGPVRALTPTEVDELCDALRTDKRAVETEDLVDLVEWMLGTGARIGESIASRDSVIDIEHGTWEINATLIRPRGRGLAVQLRPKTAAGWRVLALPPYCVAMLRRRDEEIRSRPDSFQVMDIQKQIATSTAQIVFPAPKGFALRDPRNTNRDLRAALDRHGFGWVTSHVFRKTVATRLDEAGLSARQIADQLGHAKPSMTQDVYMGRNVVSADAARILDR